MGGDVRLRAVQESDLPAFFEQQLDPEAARMAAFPSRDKDAFMAHWARILAAKTGVLRTIVCEGEVAGHIVGFQQSGRSLVGYWLGKDHWGKGVATRALSLFLAIVKQRPLYAFVAEHNRASLRVLEKCGFVHSSETFGASADGVQEVLLVLDVDQG